MSISKKITYVSKFTLNNGVDPKDFEVLANELAKIAASEKGTVEYNYYDTPDKAVFTFIETYADSDAAITHGSDTGKIVGEMANISQIDLEVYGPASQKLQDSLANANVIFFSLNNPVPALG